MKLRILSLLLLISLAATAQRQTENIIIITTDGFRWQELFGGMDTAIANNPKYNQGDSSYLFQRYWHPQSDIRRKMLLPFVWNTISSKGQLFGNRWLGCRVDNANPYWFSYPGYSEIMTGYADTAVNSNSYPPNPNTNVLEFLNKQGRLRGRVAAFGAWEAFDRILNEQRSGFPVICAFDTFGGKKPTANERLLNTLLKNGYKPWLEGECLDMLTHYGAMEWLKTRKPRVLYIAYGETDEWAHAGQYRSYLDAAHQFDSWLKDIWDFVQKDPQYKNKTTLLITTDHGRGDLNKEEWTSHNNKIQDAHEIWFAAMGPDTPVRGEWNQSTQLYQQQLAQTIARLMGYTFTASHPVADEILYVFKMRK